MSLCEKDLNGVVAEAHDCNNIGNLREGLVLRWLVITGAGERVGCQL